MKQTCATYFKMTVVSVNKIRCLWMRHLLYKRSWQVLIPNWANTPEGAQHSVRFPQIGHSPAQRSHSHLHLSRADTFITLWCDPGRASTFKTSPPARGSSRRTCTSPAQSQQPASSCRLLPVGAAGWCGGWTARWPSERWTLCSHRWSPRTGSGGSSRPSLWRGSPAAPSCRGSTARQACRGWKEACNPHGHTHSVVTLRTVESFTFVCIVLFSVMGGYILLTQRSPLGVKWWWWPLWSRWLTAGEAALRCSSTPELPESETEKALWRLQITWTSLLITRNFGKPCCHRNRYNYLMK